MDINDNQQINTFLKGMNTDVSDALIESSQYRYAENLRLVTNTDSNGGELHLIDGTIVRCGGFNSRMSNALPTDNIEILYLTSIRDYVIVIVRNNSKTQLEWSILVSNDKGYTFNEIFGPCTDPIWTDTVAISGVCRYESDKNVKLYFTDNTGRHGIMSRLIDANHQIRTTDITELTGYQDTSLKQLSVSISDTPGQLKAARVLYSYRLYKYGGGATSVSPLSKVLSLYRSNNYEGYESELISERAVDINVSYLHGEINDNLNRIQIFRINYVQQGQEPTVHLIYDNEFNGSISFTDTGINVEPLSVSEFLSYIQMRIMPKLIESKGDYLYAANIKYVQDDVDEELGIKDDIVPGLSVSWGYTPMETLTLKNNQYSYKEQDKTTLRRGEVYRYGVIFYDNFGRSSSVKWVGDLLTPDWVSGDISIDTSNMQTDASDAETFKIRRVFAKVTVPNILNCSGFEIVRCLRTTLNKKILFLGMIGFPQETTKYYTRRDGIEKDVKDKCCPSGLLTLSYMLYKYNSVSTGSDDYQDQSDSTKKLLLFVCPEYTYQPDDVEDIFRSYKSQILLKHVISYLTKSRSVSADGATLYGPDSNESSKGLLFLIVSNKLQYNKKSIPNAGSWSESVAVNHVIPLSINTNNAFVFKDTKIKDIGFTKQPNPEHWQNLQDVKFQDDSTPVGGIEYINWVAPTVLHYTTTDLNELARPTSHVASGGMSIIIRPEAETNLPVESNLIFPLNIVNVVNENASYGDHKYSSYYSFGNYFNASELGTTVSVYDGDAYILTFNYNVAHYAGYYSAAGATTDSGLWKENTLCSVYTVPIETDIDLRAQRGERFIDSGDYRIQDDPISLPNGYSLTTPAYVYNTAYNQEAITVSGSSQEYTDIDSNNYDTRIHHSQLKTNGEHIDNWLEFKSADFIDVDSRYGEITELKLFKDKLLYWLNTAVGVLSANDRTIITDMDNNLIILGNGGVLQRFDYITTLYGMKPDLFADTQSNTTLYWWDGNNKEILAYAGDGVLPLGTLKSVRNYLNERDEVQNPHLFYDEKYKEVIFSVVHNTDNYKESLVYNEHVTAFTSIYRFMPLFSTIVQGDVVVANSSSLHTYSVKEGTINNSVLFGDAVRPLLQYIVNKNNIYNKVFDISTFGGRFYGGDNLNNLTFTFDTPLKQHSTDGGNSLITNREYDFRLDIPRNNNSSYGDRMRGKTMQCELKSSSNSTDFSLQYITTKYRMSWS